MKRGSPPKKKIGFDPERCNDLYEDLVKVFQLHKPSVGEVIIALGNLTYTLGASIGGYTGQGPSPDEVEKLYYEHPEKIENALMVQGMLVTSWFSSWEKLYLETISKTETVQKDKKNG